MKEFVLYLKQEKRFLVFAVGMMALTSVVFWLYGVSGESILYGMGIVSVFLILFLCMDFVSFHEKMKNLGRLDTAMQEGILELPEPSDPVEEQYCHLLKTAVEARQNVESEADKKIKDMTEYYTMWAHQIKTPIAGMSLMLQQDDSSQAGIYKEQLFKIEQYVEMVLQYMRTENMSGDLKLKRYALDDIVKTAIRKNSRLFIAKKLGINYEGVSCEVLTDEKWLVFVIGQILSNAVKYTEKGTISIYMAPGHEKTLVIEDMGIGIQKEDLPRVFENGFTGFNGRSDKKSTGIGLYLCKKILDRLGHGIWIESEVEKGTKVYLDLQEGKKRI